MPPRRAPKKQNDENEEIEKSKPKRGRNATAAIDNLEDEEPHKKKAPVKRGGKAAAHEAFAIVFDVGSNSAEKLHDGELSDLEHSKVVLDWVLSRKIFTEASDQFSLIFFGHETTRNDLLPDYSNVYIHNDEYETAKIEWLKILEREVETNTKCSGDYVSALFVALESLKAHAEYYSPKALTVTLISNLAGLPEEGEQELMGYVTTLAAGFNTLGAELLVVGPDLSGEPKSDSQRLGFKFITSLLDNISGSSFSFREGLSQLKFFIPKSTQPRGQPFELQLAQDFSIKIQMFVKNTEASMKISFNPVAADAPTTQLKKVRRYETAGDTEGVNVRLADIDQMADEEFQAGTARGQHVPGAKFVEKEDVIKGYRYGKSLIPFGEADQKVLEYKKEGKQLQLLQFTKLENIQPHFLLNNCRYFLPPANDEVAQTAMSALVKAMLEEEVVALCRYAYNVNSAPRVSCLIPKISQKTKLPVLMHYTMPFTEDVRNYEFPALDKIGSNPTEYQLDLIDAYIDSMMLANEDATDEKMRCKHINNPKHQYQCQLLRQKAMHPGEPLAQVDRDKLLEMLSPPKEMLEKAREVIESTKDAFKLELNPYTRIAAFVQKDKEGAVMDVGMTAKSLEGVKLEMSENKELKLKGEINGQ
ncbi:ku70/Ku80 beta-barrel domain-containing protein [Ditylenchus destructor]|uniref:Ku70/Ku80 beta-barrel domain-containing protein n=1 Tax=Ditylenchus destructor TaxID=166010 RepID=A0AAD4R0G7_9BILA|nr:ku70/Ku80 beta-barrel domain-containing protein [Ditylenchus destructor]